VGSSGGVGIIMDFDTDGNPIVFFPKYDGGMQAWSTLSLKVLNESR
jgi:hypothetical protein